MIASPLQPLANHLWQSTAFAIVCGLLTLLLKENRAQIRYCLWLAASLKFLFPFSILIDAGSHFGRHTPATMPSDLSSAIGQLSVPFGAALPIGGMPVQAAPASPIPAILLYVVWGIGFATLVYSWWLRWWRTRAALGMASPLHLPIDIRVMTSPAFGEPGVFGIRRPVLLLPDGLSSRLTPPQLEAIVTHELCHVRRLDNLAGAIHMAVEALFWFHPLVWWIGARLMEERESACDEEVLRTGSNPQVYAEGILKICELYLESPLKCMAGVTGGDLKRRIEAIMLNRTTPELSSAGKMVLATAGAAALALPIAAGVLNAPTLRAQSPSSARSTARYLEKARPSFEVASIRRCGEPNFAPSAASGDGRGGGGTGNTGDAGRLRLACRPLERLIAEAYTFANGEGKPPGFGTAAVRGGPAWIENERYTINAKPETPQTMAMMVGPMMQVLLEDRFKLKIHRGIEKIPAYALVVARGGQKLQPTKGCPVNMPPAALRPLGPGQPPPCNYQRFTDAGMDTYGWTMAALCNLVGAHVNRMVIDKTGVEGAFDFHLDLPIPPPPGAHEADDPGADPLDAVMAGLRKLGLKLEPVKGTAEFVVIDHIEHPSEN